jgi:Flp pilus assembly protein TadB
MDLDVQNFGDYQVKQTFADDANYSNFIVPAWGLGVAYIKHRKDKKKRDAQLKADLERAKIAEAENRAKYAKDFEARQKAEKDRQEAEAKQATALEEVKKADEDLKKIDKEEATQKTDATAPPASSTKKYLIYGGVGLVVVIGLVVLLKRK